MVDDIIRLYWHNLVKNFGDMLSPLIVQHVSGRVVEHAGAAEADMFALGSILAIARRALAKPSDKKPFIWGSGAIGPQNSDFVANANVLCVRGPLTLEMLCLRRGVPMGDPGLLSNELLSDDVEPTDYIGLILHHTQAIPERVHRRLRLDGRFRVIDVHESNPLQTLREIASCRHIVSSSLHGLIAADSFGIPNTWLDPTGIHRHASFKFYDYALSVGRVLGEPLRLRGIFQFADSLPKGRNSLSYATEVMACRHAVKESFPLGSFVIRAE